MNIYLDIDRVLISEEVRPAKGVTNFLECITENHDCFWLTTHCRGEECRAERYLKGVLPSEAMEYVKKVEPTSWETYKTEAIDFSEDFRWFDDQISSKERQALKEHDALDKFVKVENADLSRYC